MTFIASYPGNLYEMADVQNRHTRRGGEPLAAVLIRNPANRFDTNAIEVHAPFLGEMVGHLPAPIAAMLAQRMDAGETWAGTFSGVRISADNPDNPGVDVHVRLIENDS